MHVVLLNIHMGAVPNLSQRPVHGQASVACLTAAHR